MIASLPMYDTPATAGANDRFWTLVRDAFGRGPKCLDRDEDSHVTWQRPDLLLSQTCGLPYRSSLFDRVSLVGTPDYGVAGCAPGYYRSCLIVRADDPRGTIADFVEATLARNSACSQSGWAAIMDHLVENNSDFNFEGRILNTGAHALSAQAVAMGDADIAALDAVTWTLIQRENPFADRLRVMDVTRPTPGLPFICAQATDVASLHSAINSAIAALSAGDRETLCLKGLVQISKGAYLAEPLPPYESAL